jgi:autotransporter-associated beta strand protein
VTLSSTGRTDFNAFAGTIALGSSAGVLHFAQTSNTLEDLHLANLDMGTSTAVLENTKGGPVQIGSLSGSGTGTVVQGSVSTNASTTLQIGGGSLTSTTFAGAIKDGTAGASALTAVTLNSGTLALTGANTYTGATAVKNGTLVLGSGGSLSGSNSLTLGDATANTSGVFQLGDATAAVNATVTSLTTAGTGTANAVVGGNAAVSTLTVNNSGSVTYAGLLGGVGTNQNNLALTMSGSGKLTLSGANTYSGNTMISAGTLVVTNTTGSATGSGNVSVASSASLGGSGTISGGVTLNGSIFVGSGTTAGSTNGTLTTGGQTWNNGGAYSWKVSTDGSGTAGVNWDLLSFSSLNIVLGAGDTFTINIVNNGFSSFDHTHPYTWKIAQATGGGSITNFDATKFVLNASGFTGIAAGDYFYLTDPGGTELDVNYAPEPSSLAVLAMAAVPPLLGRRRRRRCQKPSI